MDIDQMSIAVAKWAATEPLVRKAYLFGSRVRGTHSPDSDLGVAIELQALACGKTPSETWTSEAKWLRESIAPILPVHIDLEWYGGPEQTPTVHAGLSCSSRVVYEAAAIAALHVNPRAPKPSGDLEEGARRERRRGPLSVLNRRR